MVLIPYILDRHGSITGNRLLDTSLTKQAANPHPHPIIILTTRLIRNHEHRHKVATLIMRTILMKSNHNHDKHLIQQHTPKAMMKKLPK